MTERELLDQAHQNLRVAQQALRRARKEARLCIECERPAEPNKTRCQKHLDQMKDRAERLRRSA